MDNLQTNLNVIKFVNLFEKKFKRKNYFDRIEKKLNSGKKAVSNIDFLEFILHHEYDFINPGSGIFAKIRFNITPSNIKVLLTGPFLETPKSFECEVNDMETMVEILYAYIHNHTKAAIAIQTQLKTMYVKGYKEYK